MYGTAKRLAKIGIIFCCLNIFSTVLGLVGLVAFNLDMNIAITLAAILVSTSVTSLILTIVAIDLCNNLELTFDSEQEHRWALEKRILALEEKIKKY